jgi:hypothetical protein
MRLTLKPLRLSLDLGCSFWGHDGRWYKSIKKAILTQEERFISMSR